MKRWKFYPSDYIGFAALAVVVTMMLCCSPAHGASICRGNCQKQVVLNHQVAYQSAVYPNIVYAVGADIRQQAVETHQFRASDEYGEYLELKAWRAGFEAARQQTAPMQQEPAEQGTWGNQPADPSQQPAEPEANQPPTNIRYPILQANCAKCHSGDEPKGGIWLDGSVDLRGPEAAEERDKILAQTWNGHMPKKIGPLDDETLTALLEELYGEAETDGEQ